MCRIVRVSSICIKHTALLIDFEEQRLSMTAVIGTVRQETCDEVAERRIEEVGGSLEINMLYHLY